MTEAPPEQPKKPPDHTLHIRIPHSRWEQLSRVGEHKGTGKVVVTFTVLAYERLDQLVAELP